ncbi:hypothetical protein B4U84_30190 [Westiellopsis prolifica IICB1]|nr:hypothetical protein B4U84_30190 [Westiellopsis prolifica IICB1]
MELSAYKQGEFLQTWLWKLWLVALCEKPLTRESKYVPKYGWHNQSLFSRLPKWMVVAKHRSVVLSAAKHPIAFTKARKTLHRLMPIIAN